MLLPGKRCWIPLFCSFFTSWAESPGMSEMGLRLLLMSLWITSGWASHWGRTLCTCEQKNTHTVDTHHPQGMNTNGTGDPWPFHSYHQQITVPFGRACSQNLPELWIQLEQKSSLWFVLVCHFLSLLPLLLLLSPPVHLFQSHKCLKDLKSKDRQTKSSEGCICYAGSMYITEATSQFWTGHK